MSESTAMVTYDDAVLARLAGMVNAGDAPVQAGPETLKINYDEESKYPRGSWVLGQKKDENGNITEEGHLVSKVIILTTRCRWSYYNETTKTGFSTQMFEPGSQPRDKAEFDRKVAEQGGEASFQVVVLGLAIVEKTMKEFVAYIKGSAYKAMRDHLQDITTYKLPHGGSTKVPPFVFVTELGECEKKKNGTVTYWVPSFKKGVEVPVSQLDMLNSKRDAAYQYIEYANSRANEKKKEWGSDDGGHSAPSSTPPVYTPPAYTPPPPAGGVANPAPIHSTGDKMPWEDDPIIDVSAVPVDSSSPGEPGEPTGDDFDIEAAMRNIMGK